MEFAAGTACTLLDKVVSAPQKPGFLCQDIWAREAIETCCGTYPPHQL